MKKRVSVANKTWLITIHLMVSIMKLTYYRLVSHNLNCNIYLSGKIISICIHICTSNMLNIQDRHLIHARSLYDMLSCRGIISACIYCTWATCVCLIRELVCIKRHLDRLWNQLGKGATWHASSLKLLPSNCCNNFCSSINLYEFFYRVFPFIYEIIEMSPLLGKIYIIVLGLFFSGNICSGFFFINSDIKNAEIFN